MPPLVQRSFAALSPYALSGALVLLTAGAGAALRAVAPVDSVTSLFLAPVVASAVMWGFGPGLLAAALGILAGTLFYEPILSFEVHAARDIIDLALFAAVALVTSRLADGLRRRTLETRRREQELRQVFDLSRELAAAPDAKAVLDLIARHMSTELDRRVAIIAASGVDRPPDDDLPPGIVERARAMLARGERQCLARSEDGASWVIAAISDPKVFGVAVAACVAQSGEAAPELIAQARSFLAEGSSSLERLGVAQAVEERRVRERTEEIRAALLDAASHELRTPLAAVLGATTSIAAAPEMADKPALRALAELAADESRRLDRVIQNVLDASRIRSGALTARVEATEAADILRTAVAHTARHLRAHRVEVEIAPDLPLVLADPVLIEHALVNVIENAAKFSPAGSIVRLDVAADEDHIAFRVSDQGAGMTSAERDRAFERFYRSERLAGATQGVGLGLAVARAFVEASGGSIRAHSLGPGHGSSFTIRLPGVAADAVDAGEE